MADLETATGETATEASASAPGTKIRVPITKAKGEFVEIDTAELPDEVYKEALLQGLKVLANRGTSKITKSTYPDADELKTAAIAKANEQVEAMKAGKIKITGGKASGKASGAVMTEARRIAKNLVKDALKANGIKISHVDASEITKAANALLAEAEGKDIIAQATANLAERAKTKIGIDVTKLVSENPTKVAKAEAKKAKDREQLSAKQAGKVKHRAKGEMRSQA